MILQGRGISPGTGKGDLVLSEKAVSFLGGVNPVDGILAESEGLSIRGKVFAFPRGKGSTVGSYTMLEMKRLGTLPAAIVNAVAEPIVATGAVMAEVPLVDHIDLTLLRPGDHCIVDGQRGTVDIEGIKETKVVTAILQHKGKILLLKRSGQVGTYQGKWAGVSGYIEDGEGPMEAALREVQEETSALASQLIMVGVPVLVRGDGRMWSVYPFLFKAAKPDITLDWEHTEYRWLSVKDALQCPLVPGMDKVFQRLRLSP